MIIMSAHLLHLKLGLPGHLKRISADPFSSKGEAYGKGGYKSKAGW